MTSDSALLLLSNCPHRLSTRRWKFYDHHQFFPAIPDINYSSIGFLIASDEREKKARRGVRRDVGRVRRAEAAPRRLAPCRCIDRIAPWDSVVHAELRVYDSLAGEIRPYGTRRLEWEISPSASVLRLCSGAARSGMQRAVNTLRLTSEELPLENKVSMSTKSTVQWKFGAGALREFVLFSRRCAV
jgi:hypothetical protein